MTDCGIRWGATVSDTRVWVGDDQRDWSVTVESEPLEPSLNDTVLQRFTDAAVVEAGEAASCSRQDDRLGLTLTVRAPGIEEAADSAAHTFSRALAAALWPRYQPSTSAQWRIRVEATEPVLAA